MLPHELELALSRGINPEEEAPDEITLEFRQFVAPRGKERFNMIINSPLSQRFLSIGRKLGVGLQTGLFAGFAGGLWGEVFNHGNGILWGLAIGSAATAAAIFVENSIKKEQANGQSNPTKGLPPPHG